MKSVREFNRDKRKNLQGGQFLLEVIIAVAIMLMLMHAFFTLISTSYQILAQSRSQTVARALANEKMELARNLPYDDVGTVGGLPSGGLLQQETVLRNGQAFTVNTAVIYKDDPFDGQAPTDLLPADYKIVRVEITWTLLGFPTNKSLVMVTNIAPRGVETTAGGGTLSILVFDSQGQPVPQADVHIEASTINPPVNLDLQTDNLGNLILPGAPVCTDCYHVTVSKNGYSTDRTYTTAEVTNPSQPPLTVIESKVTEVSFSIDQLTDVTFNSVADRGTGYQALGGVNFHLVSGKIIGTNAQAEVVYKLVADYVTDASGQFNTQLEWDNYTLSLDGINYNLGGSNPFSPIPIPAGSISSINFVAIPNSNNSLLTQIQDSSGVAVVSALVRLSDLVYDGTMVVGNIGQPDEGQAFFSNLSDGAYTLEVSHPNFETYSDSIDILGETKGIVILNPL